MTLAKEQLLELQDNLAKLQEQSETFFDVDMSFADVDRCIQQALYKIHQEENLIKHFDDL